MDGDFKAAEQRETSTVIISCIDNLFQIITVNSSESTFLDLANMISDELEKKKSLEISEVIFEWAQSSPNFVSFL